MEMKNLNGNLFDIQRMSLHDGPGIRTTVFLKGCSMHCFWCHNPESLSPLPDVQFFPVRCIGCRLCEDACDWHCHRFEDNGIHIFNRECCIGCGKCTAVCPSGSLVKTGYSISPEQLADIVSRDKTFFDHSGGGVTISGGEPLLQPDFVTLFFRLMKKMGIHTAVETALNIPSESLKAVLPETDLFLADLKHPDPRTHRTVTGVGNELILQNLSLLDSSRKPYAIRIPVIPGVNDTEEVMNAFQVLIDGLNHPLYLELMPYHEYGVGKYDSLSKDCHQLDGLHPPTKEKLIQLAKCFNSIQVRFRDGAKEIMITGGVLCEENQP